MGANPIKKAEAKYLGTFPRHVCLSVQSEQGFSVAGLPLETVYKQLTCGLYLITLKRKTVKLMSETGVTYLKLQPFLLIRDK